ncbi:MAG TPA: type II CAAX endopeptidase family protein [Vicinamibacteria bacterium]|nr:type II CAAX endopeptidase family protein [Vicinamibacteria bacterium]
MLISFKRSILIRGVGRPSTAAAVRGVGHNALKVVASGSSPRRTSVHPVLAVVAFAAGLYGMGKGGAAVSRHGIHVTLATAETLLALPSLIALAISGIPLAAGLGLKPVPARTALLSALAGGALWSASLGLMNVQFMLWRPPPEYLDYFRGLHELLRPQTVVAGVLSIAAIALMPALCEETLFRGVLLPSFARAYPVFGLLGSSLFFAAIHADPLGQSLVFYRLPFAFAVGLGLAALRLLTGSLLPSMVAHAVLNTITFLTVFLSGAASDALEEPQALSGLLLLVGGAAATAWLFRALRR